jgi:hypothetical protein
MASEALGKEGNKMNKIMYECLSDKLGEIMRKKSAVCQNTQTQEDL